MRALAFLLCLARIAPAEDVEVRMAAELPAADLVEQWGRVLDATYLYPPADLKGRVLGGKYDFVVPKERLSEAALFLMRQCGLDPRPYPPVTVILPGTATETRFRATGLKADIQFDRGPGAWTKAPDGVGSLSQATVDALLAEAAAGNPAALDVLAAFGPRSPLTTDAVSRLLAAPALRKKAASTLARFGWSAKPALAALQAAAKADPALEPFVREVEAARHPGLLDPSLANGTAPERFLVRFATTQGEFDVEVQRDWAPLGADRFHNLVRIGFYDGGRFFRVLPGFVAQFGKSPDPEVNKVWYGAEIKDDPVRESNKLGYLTFATDGKDSRATQVFVNLADNPNLDKKGFSPIGRVVKGMDVVKRLYGGYGDAPDQNMIHFKGDRYLEESFPRLDRIISATIVEP